MFSSRIVRLSSIAVALQLAAGVSFAQATGVACQLSSDGVQQSLVDGLDDLAVGPLAGTLTRTCDASSAWPGGTYTVGAKRGVLQVVETLGSPDYHSLATGNQDAGMVFGDFAPNANSFWMVVHGADAQGNFVKNTKMHILVKAVDGTVLWSKHFLVNGMPYSLGMSGPSPIATVELKRSVPQINGVDDSLAVVDMFATVHDSSYDGQDVAAQVKRFMGPQ